MSEKMKKDWGKFKEETIEQEQVDSVIESDEDETGGEGDGSLPEALSHLSYLELEEKLTLAEQKSHENWEKAARAMAEVDNIRRRTERDIANAHRYSLEKFSSALLPVGDSLEQALQLADKHQDKGMHEGLELTIKQYLDVLEKFGVQQINPEGEPFDPQFHEAMAMQEAADVVPNTIITVFQKGYKLNDRMIRPARVIVSK